MYSNNSARVAVVSSPSCIETVSSTCCIETDSPTQFQIWVNVLRQRAAHNRLELQIVSFLILSPRLFEARAAESSVDDVMLRPAMPSAVKILTLRCLKRAGLECSVMNTHMI